MTNASTDFTDSTETTLDLKGSKKSKLGRIGRTKVVPDPTLDPKEALRKLIIQHRIMVRTSVSLNNVSTDKKNKVTGELMPCPLPADVQVDLQNTSGRLKDAAKRLETQMLVYLRQIPIYNVFLKHIFGFGTVASAYVVGNVDIRKANKCSQLQVFCGTAPCGRYPKKPGQETGDPTGRLERATRGEKLRHVREIRKALYLVMKAMLRNAAKAANGRAAESDDQKGTTKYLDRWRDHKYRLLSSDRVKDGKIAVAPVAAMLQNKEPMMVSARGFADKAGMWVAANQLVEDIYTVWRAIEGLPVWPDYHAAKLGYSHGGKVCVNEPRMLTVEEALETVEFHRVGRQPLPPGAVPLPEDVAEDDPGIIDPEDDVSLDV